MQSTWDQITAFLGSAVPWTPNAFVNIHAFVFEPDQNGKPKLQPRASRAARDLQEAASFCQWCDAQGWEVYVAMASQRQPGTGKPDKRGKVNHRALRGEANSIESRSFFLDVDVKEGAYATSQEALDALKAFCGTIGLPPPSIVVWSGGGGFHAHWLLDHAITPQVWKPLANKLADACRVHGLKADGNVTVDVSHILRVPGTTNRKYDAGRQVRMDVVGTQVTLDMIRLPMEPFADIGLQPKNSGSAGASGLSHSFSTLAGFPVRSGPPLDPAITAKFLGGTELEDPSIFDVANGCPLIKDALITGGANYREPLWFETGKVASFTEEGLEAFRAMSNKHPGYHPVELDDKYAYIVSSQIQSDRGWPRCATIENAGSHLCARCPNKVAQKSPLSFARKNLPAPTVTNVTPASNPASTPLIPVLKPIDVDGYMQGTDGIVKFTDEEGIEQRVWGYPIWNLEPWRTGEVGGAVHFDTQFDAIIWKHVVVPTGALFDRRSLREVIMGRYMLGLDEDDTKGFMKFMSAFLEQLRSKRVTASVQENLGWSVDGHGNPSGFVYGSTRFNCNGNAAFFQSDPIIKKIWTPAGTFDAWKAAIAMINAEKRPSMDLLVATAFASPLLRFSGHSGVVISGFSPGSAHHKTTALRIGQATWGSPEGINQLSDTLNSVIEKIGKTKVLPAYYDEMKASKDIEKFANMVFTLSGGRGKGRLGRNSEIREVGTWDTMLVGASNDSLVNYLIDNDRSTEAGVNRVFEFEVDKPVDHGPGQIAMGDAGKIIAALKDNYGHAGLVYAEYLGQKVQVLPTMVTDTINTYEKIFNAQPSERFWIITMAMLTLGAQMANNLNLTRFDVGKMVDFMAVSLNQLRKVRAAGDMDVSKAPTIISTLAFFMNTHRRSTIITDTLPTGAGRLGLQGTVRVINPDDVRQANFLVTHIAQIDNKVRFSKRMFLQWCQEKNMPGGVLLTNIMNTFGAKELHTKIGVGTQYTSAAKERLIELDCNHPDLITLMSN